MFLSHNFNPEVVHYRGDGDMAEILSPEARSEAARYISLCGEMGTYAVVGNRVSLG